MKRSFQIAIIAQHWLPGAGLKALLAEYYPLYKVTLFTDEEEFRQAARITRFDHIFTVGENRIADGIGFDTHSAPDKLLESLHEILHIEPETDDKHPALTPREVDVLRLVTQGLLNKEIADRLEISLHTVISHRKNITAKLGIKTVSGLTIYSLMHGLIE